MRKYLVSIVALTVLSFGCGGDSDSVDVEDVESALSANPWNGVFSIWSTSPTTWAVNPIGSPSLICPDGTVATACVTDRLNLGRAGLDSTKIAQLLQRINTNGTTEANTAVLVRGSFVTVRDHRTTPTTNYAEFRVEAAYTAPSVRQHVSGYGYLFSSSGLQALHAVNGQSGPSFQVELVWALPGGQNHPGGLVDDQIVTLTSLDPWPSIFIGANPPVIFHNPPPRIQIDQLFNRFQ